MASLETLLAKIGVRASVVVIALWLLAVGIMVDLVVFRRPWSVDPEASFTEGERIKTSFKHREIVQQAGLYGLGRVFKHLSFLLPVAMEQSPDGRWFLIDRYGQLHVFEDDPEVRTSTVLLDLTGRVDIENPEEGLLGLALHPDFGANGRLYLFFTVLEQPRRNVLVEYTMAPDDPNRLDPTSERILLSVPQHTTHHNGGGLVFGPDGMLYLSVGDGGGWGDPTDSAQDLTKLLAKMLRIDVDRRDPPLDYGIPLDNPFVGVEGARREIWAVGLRNAWRFSFDRETGILWAGDVGERAWEEINHVVRGGNYGWVYYEGTRPYRDHPLGIPDDIDFIPPIWEYDQHVGACVIGGFVYRGQRLPALRGLYIFADWVFGTVWALDWEPGGTATVRTVSRQPKNITSFAERSDGELYLLAGDKIWELVPRDLGELEK